MEIHTLVMQDLAIELLKFFRVGLGNHKAQKTHLGLMTPKYDEISIYS